MRVIIYRHRKCMYLTYDYCRDVSLEDQRLLSSFLPLLREVIPNAAAEVEADISDHSIQGCFLVTNYH